MYSMTGCHSNHINTIKAHTQGVVQDGAGEISRGGSPDRRNPPSHTKSHHSDSSVQCHHSCFSGHAPAKQSHPAEHPIRGWACAASKYIHSVLGASIQWLQIPRGSGLESCTKQHTMCYSFWRNHIHQHGVSLIPQRHHIHHSEKCAIHTLIPIGLHFAWRASETCINVPASKHPPWHLCILQPGHECKHCRHFMGVGTSHLHNTVYSTHENETG